MAMSDEAKLGAILIVISLVGVPIFLFVLTATCRWLNDLNRRGNNRRPAQGSDLENQRGYPLPPLQPGATQARRGGAQPGGGNQRPAKPAAIRAQKQEAQVKVHPEKVEARDNGPREIKDTQTKMKNRAKPAYAGGTATDGNTSNEAGQKNKKPVQPMIDKDGNKRKAAQDNKKLQAKGLGGQNIKKAGEKK